jgi:hypothetical protein
MKFKYVGVYAPESNWEEHYYHESVLVKNGVAETESEQTAELLQQNGFVPYAKWEKQQAEEEVARREAEEKRIADYLKQREEDAENARKTYEHDSSLSKKERKALDAEAAKADGVKPVVPPDEQESSIVVNTDAADENSDDDGKDKE